MPNTLFYLIVKNNKETDLAKSLANLKKVTKVDLSVVSVFRK